MSCNLEYIPKHLHTNSNPIIYGFSLGEELYFRCKNSDHKKPYDKISLYDISHNRNFRNSTLYPQSDVFYNIIEKDSREKYSDLSYVTIVLSELEGENTYIKKIISQKDPKVESTIILKHRPVPCMYPHSVFEISLNGVVVNSKNYKKLLGKNNTTYKNIRSDIRQELTSILQTGKIDSTEDIEIIDKP